MPEQPACEQRQRNEREQAGEETRDRQRDPERSLVYLLANVALYVQLRKPQAQFHPGREILEQAARFPTDATRLARPARRFVRRARVLVAPTRF